MANTDSSLGKRLAGLVAIAGIVACCLAAIGLIPAFGQWLFPRTPKTPPAPTGTVSSATEIYVAPAETDESPTLATPLESIPPTLSPTLEPTLTAAPTATPKLYYNQSEAVILSDGVYMYLNDEFNTAGSTCGKPDVGFGIYIIIENTIHKQYIIKTNSGDFHAKDDLGNEYRLVAVGVNGDRFCNDPIGVPLEYIMSWGYWTAYIALQFEGQVPFEAQHIYITADWISGIGPTIFRKDTY